MSATSNFLLQPSMMLWKFWRKISWRRKSMILVEVTVVFISLQESGLSNQICSSNLSIQGNNWIVGNVGTWCHHRLQNHITEGKSNTTLEIFSFLMNINAGIFNLSWIQTISNYSFYEFDKFLVQNQNWAISLEISSFNDTQSMWLFSVPKPRPQDAFNFFFQECRKSTCVLHLF